MLNKYYIVYSSECILRTLHDYKRNMSFVDLKYRVYQAHTTWLEGVKRRARQVVKVERVDVSTRRRMRWRGRGRRRRQLPDKCLATFKCFRRSLLCIVVSPFSLGVYIWQRMQPDTLPFYRTLLPLATLLSSLCLFVALLLRFWTPQAKWF